MIETKVLRIENDEDVINETSHDRSCFGWSMTNLQVTHSENTKTYSSVWDQLGGNRSQTVETSIVDYATVTLQRDTAIPHYAELIALEKEYEECLAMRANILVQAERGANMSCLYYLCWPWSLLFKKRMEADGTALEEKRSYINNRIDEILRQGRALLS